MRWFRLYDELLDDPKAQQLPPPLFKHWVNAMCLASQNKPRGTLPTIPDLAFRLRVSVQKATEIVGELVSAGLVEIGDDGVICIHNWGERQRASDDVAERQRKHRSNASVTLPVTLREPLPVTPKSLSRIKEADTDTETDTETAAAAAVARDEQPPPPQFSHYENDVEDLLPKIAERWQSISPELTDGWLRGELRRAESGIGSLTRRQLVAGLKLAQSQIERKAANGGMTSPRGFAATVLRDALGEQRDGLTATAD